MADKNELIENEELPEEAVFNEDIVLEEEKPQSSTDSETNTNRCTVSECIEQIGYGRYHWKVVATMGMMSAADSAEIWIIGLISLNLTCDWKITAAQKAAVPGTVFLLMSIGSWLSGLLADIYGRRKVMLIVYYIFTVAATASAFSWNYPVFLLLRGVAGFCIGANYGVSICYSAEMVPITKRAFNLLLLDILWCIGGVFICFCAIFVMPYQWGWRYLILLAALPCLVTIPLLHICDESVRFLAVKGKLQDAKLIFDKMARQNQASKLTCEIYCPTTKTASKSLNTDLFKQPFLRRTILLVVCFGASVWVFYAFMYLLPDMMASGFCHLSEWFQVTHKNSRGCSVYTSKEYIFLIVVNLLYLPGYIISPITAEYWGRRPTLWYSFWGGLATTVLLLICIDPVVVYINLFLVINFYGISVATLWLYVPENYPTYLRSSATGAHNGFSKVGAALGTFLTEYLDSIKISHSITVLVVVLVISSVATIFLQLETKDKSLADGNDSTEMTVKGTNIPLDDRRIRVSIRGGANAMRQIHNATN